MSLLLILGSLLVIALSFFVMSEISDKYFIKSLDNISIWLKLTPSVAGATLLAFGTSAPEISTALVALNKGGQSIATGVGTIVGSAIFQMLVVIGFTALVKTSYLDWKPVIRDSLYYAFAVVLLILFIDDGIFTLNEAIVLVGAYFVYLLLMFVWSRKVTEKEIDFNEFEVEMPEKAFSEKNLILKFWTILTHPFAKVLRLIPDPTKNKKTTIPVFILSLVLIGISSFFMVNAAEVLAGELGVPQAIIALTILAGGTSIPELISSAVVAKQGRGDMAIANAIGSNIFDILVSLGLPVLIYTIFSGDLDNLGGSNITSSILLLFATLIAVISLLAFQKFKATKFFGGFLIFLYLVYVTLAYSGVIDNL